MSEQKGGRVGKGMLPQEYQLVFESVSEPGILYGSRGTFPDHEMVRLGPASQFKISKARCQVFCAYPGEYQGKRRRCRCCGYLEPKVRTS